jgi:hypothetical protein
MMHSKPTAMQGGMPGFCSRRSFLLSTGAGFGGLALRYLLDRDRLLVSEPPDAGPSPPAAPARPAPVNPLAARQPHHRPRARSAIFLFMNGGPSQVDTFDPKPALDKWDGKPIPAFKQEDAFFPETKPTAFKSPYRFKKVGRCGMEVSEGLPQIARCVDDLCLIRSMHCESNNHPPALYEMTSGFRLPGRPSMGSWITYGLGNGTEQLPAFVVMWDRRGAPNGGAQNWSSGFLPAAYQATPFRSTGDPILDLEPPGDVSPARQRARLELLARLNEDHLARHPADGDLAARIAAYELAARMQLPAAEVADVDSEPAPVRRLYGLDAPCSSYFGRQCLLARRLVERGVRFVQIYSGGGDPLTTWDAHSSIKDNCDLHFPEIDQPICGLLTDLKQRGLLGETLVIWGGEFGRMPTNQGTAGRDHNPRGFTMWLAGGGSRGGTVHGATDEFGYAAVQDPVSVHDLHATVLDLLGLDHTRLTFRHQGRDVRLTDTSGEVVRGLIEG